MPIGLVVLPKLLLNPATGVVLVNKFTIGVDSGKVINPWQLAKGVQPRRIPLTLGYLTSLLSGRFSPRKRVICGGFHSFHRGVESWEEFELRGLTYFSGVVRLQMVRGFPKVPDRAGDSQSGLK
jgi:hypothetical protein